ncbi:MAG: hypothetical protein GXY83_17785 [Rhodopirellula sp.]|nr:hypothetical protein [Rhodopirellula sp.]
MMRRLIRRATTALLLAAMSLHLHVAAVLERPARATDTGEPSSDRPASVGADTLVGKALRAMDGAEEIVFVVRDLCSAYQWYATFGEYADEAKYIHAPNGSQLCNLNRRTRQVTVLLDDPQGGFRDPRVHYDGGKVLFAYRPSGTHHYHLCEINVNGSGFRQLTSGDCDDVDPAYLPDGGIVFASSRCHRFVACNRVPAAIIYRMDADGGNIRCLSANTISEDRPAVLPDGRARRGIGFDRRRFLDYCLRSCSC